MANLIAVSYVTNTIDKEVIRLLNSGAVGFLPSDTIYGLSCRALDEQAVGRIHRLKKRDKHKPLVVLISSTGQLDELGIELSEVTPALKYWPGQLTIICNTKKTPAWLQMGTGTQSVRIPGSPGLRRLIAKTGPLISTSANLAGQEPALNIAGAKKYFGDKLDFYVNIGMLSGKPSTIVKAGPDGLEVIRPGAVDINT